jgi:hypothetical protein
MTDNGRRILTGVLAFLAVSVLGSAVKTYVDGRRDARMAQLGFDPKELRRVGQVLERRMTPLMSSPRYQVYMAKQKISKTFGGAKSGEPASWLGATDTLTARGLPRLSDWELAKFHELKQKIAFASVRACPCFWDPSTCSGADVFDGLARLSEPDLESWATLAAAAGLAELAADGPVPSTTPDLQKGVAVILARLPREQHDRLLAISGGQDSKVPVSKEDRCFGAKTLLSGADLLDAGDRPRFIRALDSSGPE